MDQVKAAITSKTLWANALAFWAIVASLLKLPTPVDPDAAAGTMALVFGHVYDLVALAAMLASSWFRVSAKKEITGIVAPK